MKIREAYKAYGNKKSLDKFCEGVAEKHGITVVPAGVVDEENPSDNYLTIYFEYKGNDEGAANFIRAIDEVSRKLATRGLALSHECNGDGSIGIIQSYRVNRKRGGVRLWTEKPIIMAKIDGRLFFENGKPNGFVPLNPFMLCIDLAKANERHHFSMNDGILLFHEGVGRFGRVAECYRMEEPTTILHYGFRLWTRIDGQEVMEIISEAENE